MKTAPFWVKKITKRKMRYFVKWVTDDGNSCLFVDEKLSLQIILRSFKMQFAYFCSQYEWDCYLQFFLLFQLKIHK